MPVSQNLLDYINSRRRDGLSDDAIRTILLSSGHTPNDVDEAIRAGNVAAPLNSVSAVSASSPAMSTVPTKITTGDLPPKIPFGVKFIAFFYYFGAVVGMLGGVLIVLIGLPGYSPLIGRIDGAIILILGFEMFYIMRELLKGMNWARWFMIIGSIVTAITFLIQFLLSASAIFHLLSSFSFGVSVFAVAVDIIPLLWSLFVGGYLFFSIKIKTVYGTEAAQAGMPGKLVGFLVAGCMLGIALSVIYYVSPHPSVAASENMNNIQAEAQQVSVLVASLNQQAVMIVSTPDAEDAATIKSMRTNIAEGAAFGTGGANGALGWEPDAQFYAYRRVFMLPSDSASSDVVLANGDSYYYQSKNTTDVYEAIISRDPTNTLYGVLKTDIDKNESTTYYTLPLQLSSMTIGPKKAFEIANLDPAFQTFKNNHANYFSMAQLSEALDPSSWVVSLAPDLNSPASDTITAYVDIATGKLLPQEALDVLQQAANAVK